MSRRMTKQSKWPVRPAKTQISLGIPQSDQNLCYAHEEALGPESVLTVQVILLVFSCGGSNDVLFCDKRVDHFIAVLSFIKSDNLSILNYSGRKSL